jgi:hypothetical protein
MEDKRKRTEKIANDADKTEAKILELVEATADTKDKGFLLILLKLNSSLAENTKVVNEVANNLEQHMDTFSQHAEQERLVHEAYTAARDQSEGEKKVWKYVITAARTILFAMIAYFQTQLIDLHNDIAKLKMEQVKLESTVTWHLAADQTESSRGK